MALLNYTTTVSAARSIAEITDILRRAKARSVQTEFNEHGEESAVAFLIDTQFGSRAYRLPVDVMAVYKVMRGDGPGHADRRYQFLDQARRVAWRIAKDWLEVQIALIQTEMATLDQVMLPYMLTDDGRTAYERLVERKMVVAGADRPLLTAPKDED